MCAPRGVLAFPQRTHSACCPPRNDDLGDEEGSPPFLGGYILFFLLLRRACKNSKSQANLFWKKSKWKEEQAWVHNKLWFMNSPKGSLMRLSWYLSGRGLDLIQFVLSKDRKQIVVHRKQIFAHTTCYSELFYASLLLTLKGIIHI